MPAWIRPRSHCAASRPVDEFDLIRRYFVREDNGPGVRVGIGDDGAVLQAQAGRELVTVIDTLVEDVHFPTGVHPRNLGYRVVAVNLSDIAAMSARPLWMTLALTIPASEESWLAEFAAGLHEAAAEYAVSLVGGDTTRGESIVVTVQVTGDVAEGAAVLRSGAREGDTIYVTGTVGDAAAGLALLRAQRADDFLVGRYLRPAARVDVGLALATVATAAIDISDGLVADLLKLLDASGVGGQLDVDSVPLSDALHEAFDADARRRFALTGGDDYELCFTAPGPVASKLAGIAVTAVGTVVAGSGLECRDSAGIVEVDLSGYRHFQ